jgi:hypothetical protein
MVINKNLLDGMEADISIEDFEPSSEADVYTMTAGSIEDNNEEEENIGVTESQISYAGNDFAYTFPEHSVTVIRLTERCGDVNGDGLVNVYDLSAVGLNFGRTGQAIQPPEADITGDGVVDIYDLVAVGRNFGNEY